MSDGSGVTAVDVLIVGRGFRRDRHGHPARPPGQGVVRHHRAGRRRRRDLAGQPLSGRVLRHPLAPVLVLLPAEPGLVPGLRRRARDPCLPARVRWRGGTRRPPAAELRAVGGGMERRRRALAGPHHPGRLLGRQPGHRHRPAVRAEDPPDQEPGRVRRTLVALGPLEREGIPGRQAGRTDRHRRLGDPDPAPAGGRGKRGRGLPAFRPVRPAARRPGVQPGGDGALRGRPGNRHRASGRAVRRGRTGPRGPPAAASGHRPAPPAGARPSRRLGPRCGAAPPADSRLRDRLQADPVLRRLLRRLAARSRAA